MIVQPSIALPCGSVLTFLTALPEWNSDLHLKLTEPLGDCAGMFMDDYLKEAVEHASLNDGEVCGEDGCAHLRALANCWSNQGKRLSDAELAEFQTLLVRYTRKAAWIGPGVRSYFTGYVPPPGSPLPDPQSPPPAFDFDPEDSVSIEELLRKKKAAKEAGEKADKVAKDKAKAEAKAAKQAAPRKKWFDWSQIPDAELTEEELVDFQRRVAFYEGDSIKLLRPAANKDDDGGLVWRHIEDNFQGKKVDAFIEDRPYNVEREKGTGKRKASDNMTLDEIRDLIVAEFKLLSMNGSVFYRIHPNEWDTYVEAIKKGAGANAAAVATMIGKSDKQVRKSAAPLSSRGSYATAIRGAKVKSPYHNKRPMDFTGHCSQVNTNMYGVGYVPNRFKLTIPGTTPAEPFRNEQTVQEVAQVMSWFAPYLGLVVDGCCGTGPTALAGLRCGVFTICIDKDKSGIIGLAERRARIYYRFLKNNKLLPDLTANEPPPPTSWELAQKSWQSVHGRELGIGAIWPVLDKGCLPRWHSRRVKSSSCVAVCTWPQTI